MGRRREEEGVEERDKGAGGGGDQEVKRREGGRKEKGKCGNRDEGGVKKARKERGHYIHSPISYSPRMQM